LADFVCNAGATIGYTSGAEEPGALFKHVEVTIAKLQEQAGAHPSGPYDGACAIAESFIETWRASEGMPPGPPLA
jgi:hypothetical protein